MALTYKLINKISLLSNTATISFTSIPSDYTDLILLCSMRSDRSGSSIDNVRLKINNLSSGYSEVTGSLFNSSISNNSASSLTQTIPIFCTASSAPSGYYSNSETTIFNYSLIQEKSISSVSVTGGSSNSNILLFAGLLSNTAIINSIELSPVLGTNFITGSSAFLYGVTKI